MTTIRMTEDPGAMEIGRDADRDTKGVMYHLEGSNGSQMEDTINMAENRTVSLCPLTCSVLLHSRKLVDVCG